MQKLLSKNLHLCFPLVKPPNPTPSESDDDHNRPFPTTTTTTTAASAVFNHYNSLYDSSTAASDPDTHIGDTEPVPNFAALHASRRFFFSSPGRSNSIIHSSSSTSYSSNSFLDDDDYHHLDAQNPIKTAGGVAVVETCYSSDMYADFRQSMEQMVLERMSTMMTDEDDVRLNWDYLDALLVKYLSLNPESAHGVIVRAFADVVLCLVAGGGGHGGGCDCH